MIPIDEEVKDWFIGICQEFANIKLIVADDGFKESVQIYFPHPLRDKFGYNKQFTTVHYMGGPNIKPAGYDYFEVRFYVGALQGANLEDIIKARPSMKLEWNGGGEKSYYKYNNFVDYDEFVRFVKPILESIHKRFVQDLGEAYCKLPIVQLPPRIRELPRAK